MEGDATGVEGSSGADGAFMAHWGTAGVSMRRAPGGHAWAVLASGEGAEASPCGGGADFGRRGMRADGQVHGRCVRLQPVRHVADSSQLLRVEDTAHAQHCSGEFTVRA